MPQFERDPSQPEAQRVLPEHAQQIGAAMVDAAADSMRATVAAREAQQAEQLARPMGPDAITVVPR